VSLHLNDQNRTDNHGDLTNRCSEPLAVAMTTSQHVYEVRPRKDHRGVYLIFDALPFARLRYEQTCDAIDCAKFRSRSHDAVIRVYDEAGNLVETHERNGEFKDFRRRDVRLAL
jgi:hypothetical protein